MNTTFIISLLSALLFGHHLCAQQPPDWENPQAVGLNKEPPRASFFAFQSEQNALTLRKEQATNYLSLNGTWKFNWVRKPADRFLDFYKRGQDFQ